MINGNLKHNYYISLLKASLRSQIACYISLYFIGSRVYLPLSECTYIKFANKYILIYYYNEFHINV